MRLLLSLTLTCIFLGCDLPRDPDGTLARVQNGVLRVGVIENEPWARRADGEAMGVEATLVREFAGELNARPEWVWGGEQEHMEALKRRELDLVIGGVTKKTPWSAEIGMTRPYFESQAKIGVPPGAQTPSEIEGQRVAVRRGSSLAKIVEEEDATAVRTDDPFRENLLVAAADWELARHNFTATEIELQKNAHVIATAPGENAFLVRLERFLRERRARVGEMLRAESEVTP